MHIDSPDPRGCRNEEPYQTTLRGLASYTLPKVDVLVSGTVRSQPPVQILPPARTGTCRTRWCRACSAGCRRAAWRPATRPCSCVDNGDNRLYVDNRRTQIDMRFAKILRFGRTRTDIGVDLYNLLNSNYALGYEAQLQLHAAERRDVAEPDVDPVAAVRAVQYHDQLLTSRRSAGRATCALKAAMAAIGRERRSDVTTAIRNRSIRHADAGRSYRRARSCPGASLRSAPVGAFGDLDTSCARRMRGRYRRRPTSGRNMMWAGPDLPPSRKASADRPRPDHVEGGTIPARGRGAVVDQNPSYIARATTLVLAPQGTMELLRPSLPSTPIMSCGP